MSEIEHYKGKLTPTGKTVDEFMHGIEIESYYESKRECFNDKYANTAIEIDGTVYAVARNEYDDCDGIFESIKNKDGSIDFHVRYYNGGCGFSEALEEALKQQLNNQAA